MSPFSPTLDISNLHYIPISYSREDSEASALRLILTLFPEWEHQQGSVEFVPFKDGITNTVCFEYTASAGNAVVNACY